MNYKPTDLVNIGKNQYKIVSIQFYKGQPNGSRIHNNCKLQNTETLETFEIPLSLIENVNK